MFENISRKLFILHQNTVILKWFSSLCSSFHFRFETKVFSIWRNQRSCRQIYYDQYRCKYTQLYNEYLLMRVQKCLKNILQSSLFFFRMMKLWKKVKNIKLMVNITRKYFSLVSYSSSLPFLLNTINIYLWIFINSVSMSTCLSTPPLSKSGTLQFQSRFFID